MSNQKKFYVFLIILLTFVFTSKASANLTFTNNAITGDTASNIDVGAGNSLLLQSINNGPVMIGTGPITIGGAVTISGLAGTGTRCLNVSSTGVIGAATSDCGTGGSNVVTGASTLATATWLPYVTSAGVLGTAPTHGGPRVLDNATSPNSLSGYAGNVIDAANIAATIGGGGTIGFENKILCTLGDHCADSTISGGYDNQMDSAYPSTIGGGAHNRINMATSDVGRGLTLPAYIPTTVTSHDAILSGTFHGIYSATYSTIAGGTQNYIGNIAVSDASTIGGGASNGIPASADSTIGGGTLNTISYATSSTIAGGQSNAINGATGHTSPDSTIGGGINNTIAQDSNSATIGGGGANTASGIYATIPGGYTNTASGYASIAAGAKAVASDYGETSYASGAFTNSGDAQVRKFVQRKITTDATPTYLYNDGTGQQMHVPVNSAWNFQIQLVAHRTDAINESGAWNITGIVDEQATASTIAFVGTPTVTVVAADSAWTPAVVVNTTSGLLRIQVTGEAGKTIRWVAYVTAVQVSN